MWLKSQNIDKPISDKSGQIWHFAFWHDFPADVYTQRIYFWNDKRSQTGIMEFVGDSTLHISRIKQRMNKLAKNKQYRKQFLCDLRFPVEK